MVGIKLWGSVFDNLFIHLDELMGAGRLRLPVEVSSHHGKQRLLFLKLLDKGQNRGFEFSEGFLGPIDPGMFPLLLVITDGTKSFHLEFPSAR
jgi:hypothetical protein